VRTATTWPPLSRHHQHVSPVQHCWRRHMADTLPITPKKKTKKIFFFSIFSGVKCNNVRVDESERRVSELIKYDFD
jgi:hypothetical protein